MRKSMYSFYTAANLTEYSLSEPLESFYINLTHIFPFGSHIKSGSHENTDIIRSSVISQSKKIVIVTTRKGKVSCLWLLPRCVTVRPGGGAFDTMRTVGHRIEQ